MKTRVLLPVLAFLATTTALAQAPYTEFKAGLMNPKSAQSGYLFGVNLGRTIDESLSWGLEINYYHKNYKDDFTVLVLNKDGLQVEQKVRNQEVTTRILPLLAKLNYEHPMGYRSPFYLRASAGLGWELVWNTATNYVEQTHRTRFFHGFGWQLSSGLGLGISSSGNVFLDVFYNGSKVKRNQSKTELGLPTWEELDISGFGIKFGVSIVGFGW